MKIIYLIIAAVFIPCCVAHAQSNVISVYGKVVDENNNPIEFSTIGSADANASAFSNADGEFTLRLKNTGTDSIKLSISFVGMRTVNMRVSGKASTQNLLIRLQALSLTLNEVQISSQRKKSDISNSAIVFDREAIEQVQAYSLADIMNNLPGKRMSAPDLQYNQQLTLRSASTGDATQQNNNARGVAIFVDGIRQSNDANMQTRSVGVRGVNGGAIGNVRDIQTGSPQYDSPFGGIDIRNIPADNIESIEVVSGVASAKYGELTDGAVIINRMAGKTDYRVNLRLNGASTNASISKGVLLGKRAGAMNVNFNYLNSIQDPRDNMKIYSRISGGAMWTVNLTDDIKNTFSVDYSQKMDDAKLDPDDDNQQIMYSKDQRISLSNRLSVALTNSSWLRRIGFSASYDEGYQESYRQRQNNGAPVGIADKDTTGIYEGYFIPGNFTSVDHIKGKPYNGSASLDLSNTLRSGKITHNLSLGSNFSFSGNKGEGVIADPTKPYINTPGNKSERPYDFDLLRDIYSLGFYLEDKASTSIFNRPLSVSAGLRYDIQNGYGSWQPRVNASYDLSKKWAVNAAFGMASKAPSMSFRYPAPTYFDIPLLNLYNGYVNESVFLVYTEKIIKDNSNIKPSRSNQMELGVSYDGGWFNSSLFGYIKRNRDGLTSAMNYVLRYLPTYDTVITPGQKPVYTPTGNLRAYPGLQDNSITNSVRSDNYGIEWFISTRKVRAIQTSFDLNTSYSYSRYNNLGTSIRIAGESYLNNNFKAWYGIYPATNTKNRTITSKLTTNTHIPKLGFVVSLMADVYWQNITETLGNSNLPVAYIDRDGNLVPIEVYDANNTDYNYLALTPTAANKLSQPPFVYTNMSLRVSKEIRKKICISVYAYNFLNIIVRDYNEILRNLTTYNNPVNVGAELSFKF
ncbi:TonB-dependent receptor [Mucilaginibacter sp. JRF]|uniref:TonB-dependent receptor n=1 Tax=Mucilaginibacter sp. JRF TaxID=2780088 RepID=UPI00187F7AD0|nr:TonB-dependent receptor [Mucilaginibacter sp. JRF]MBE9585040.1 TonB-dependent receptor [Mucilaginibacter sp. JRF]